MAFVGAKRHELDMTQGNIAGNLIRFAFPLLLGNLFQQLYNMVDTWVIGQWGLEAEYSAVGTVGPIINMLIGIFVGLSGGAGVVISTYFGAGNTKKVHDAVHTSVVMTLVLSVLFTVLGIALTPVMLDLMLQSKVEDSALLPYATTYLTIYFAGVVGLLVYNMGSGILRAVGDSKRPFYFLVVSAVLNIILDIVFVVGFRMGVAGVALATVLAQLVSATLTVIVLLRTDSCVKLILKDLHVDFPMLGKIVRIGIPTALQLAITAFSNVFVQSYIGNINPIAHQTEHLGAWTTYAKLDQIMFLPPQSLSVAVMTFVGQNLGKGDVARAKKGASIAYLQSSAITAVVMIPLMVFAPQLSAFFNDSPLVVEYATILLRTLTPFYLVCSVNQIFSGALRGAGNTRAPMINMLVAFVLFRQIYLFVMTNYISNDLIPVAMSYPAGWVLCCVLTLITYFGFRFDKSRVMEK
ncbi:MAG: MATE family efflux transporter [Clostridia bacterium]|nr:MATE family efflux transporter [Clostridia bacterium]